MFKTQNEKCLYDLIILKLKKGDIDNARKLWDTNRKKEYATFEEVLEIYRIKCKCV